MYYKSNAKPGLRLKEKLKKEYVLRNYQSISGELPVVYPQVLRSQKLASCTSIAGARSEKKLKNKEEK